MLDQVFEVFDIIFDYDLNIMVFNQDLYDIIIKVFLGLCDVLKDFCLDMVLVYGDIIMLMVVLLVVFYWQVVVGYVEVGLCIYDMLFFWLEEMNCQVIDCICIYYFVFIGKLKQNLLQENIDVKKIFVIGNMVIDVLLMVVDIILKKLGIKEKLYQEFCDKGYEVG